MKRKTTLIAIVGIAAVCALGFSLISGAQPKGQANLRQMPVNRENAMQFQRDGAPGPVQGGPVQGRDAGFGINLAGVELSDEQREQIQQQMRDFQVNTADIRQQLQFAEQDLRQEMRNDPVDQAKVDSLWAKITDLNQKMGEAQVNHMLALKGILTPEQLATIQKNEQVALELQKLRIEQRELLLASGAPDVQRLQQIQAEIAEKEVALQRERFENIAEKFANLTPEQQEKLQQFRSNRGHAKPQARR